jgi:hypothetical protein
MLEYNIYFFSFTLAFDVHAFGVCQIHSTTLILKKSIIFWDITPCSPLSVNRSFGETYRLHLQGRRNKFRKKPASVKQNNACHQLACWFLAELISSTLKIEAFCSSETSVVAQRTTRRYIPEDDTLHKHRCENLKSYNSHFI